MPGRLLLSVLAGLSLWLAQPGFDIWPAAPIGVALLAFAARDVGGRRGALLGVICGAAFLTPLLSWTGIYVGPFPWLALSVLEALYYGLVGAVVGMVPVRNRWFPGLLGAAWATMELLRSTTPYGGFPWARIAFGMADSPYAPLASWVGAPGVGFVVAATGGALAVVAARCWLRWVAVPRAGRHPLPGGRWAHLREYWWRRRGESGTRRIASSEGMHVAGKAAMRRAGVSPTWKGLVVAAVLTILPLAIPLSTEGPTARLMAIQGNVPTAGLEFNAQRRAVLDNHARLTAKAAEDRRDRHTPTPDLVIWPENASDIDPLRNADAAQIIADAVRTIGAPTLVGAVLSEPVDHVTNASLLYVPGQQQPTQRYDKRHPVPFGEYIPQREFFRMFSDKVDLIRRDFVGGTKVGVIRVPRAGGAPEVAAGINICFEVAYDDLVRDGVRAGANVIVVQTNNATFGYTDESVQQLAISRIRAIEHGRSVVHISNVGVSSLITPDGVPHGWTGKFQPAVLDADMPLRSEMTLATRLGDVPAWLAAAVTVWAMGSSWWRRRRRMS
ncbi:apolipoprotein N-acyltransferase [Austwickia sp. TVS 96-490-7B]|uniref:apolipoprotein N-acyltransferase n=1 Tax=Austwickia sp. TVS 96-490-7B TaxID=2830843 RepID=UPI001C595916|nr:apolipoprotein N-acyltransferase [Austwickia sp. TVS 96-490-7B]